MRKNLADAKQQKTHLFHTVSVSDIDTFYKKTAIKQKNNILRQTVCVLEPPAHVVVTSCFLCGVLPGHVLGLWQLTFVIVLLRQRQGGVRAGAGTHAAVVGGPERVWRDRMRQRHRGTLMWSSFNPFVLGGLPPSVRGVFRLVHLAGNPRRPPHPHPQWATVGISQPPQACWICHPD